MATRGKIAAFPDGNSFVAYNDSVDNLVIGNSEGLVKVFNIHEPDLEPTSIDILENLTSLSNHGAKLLITTTGGELELIDLKSSESKGSIYRSGLPLRDSLFINEGKRVLCGGDDNKLVVIDLENGNNTSSVSLSDQFLSVAYNYTGELLAVGLSSGDVQLYSVTNEQPNLIHTIPNVLVSKIHTSMDKIDYNEEHEDELVSTRPQWTSDGRYLLVPTAVNKISVFDRSNWAEPIKSFDSEAKIIDFRLSPTSDHLAVLDFDGVVRLFDFDSKKTLREIELDLDGKFPLNLAWKDTQLFVGTTDGSILTFKDVVDSATTREINRLFMGEADESDGEDSNTEELGQDEEENEEEAPDVKSELSKPGYRLHAEDPLVIDQDEDDMPDYSNDRRKRHKPNGYSAPRQTTARSFGTVIEGEIKPYSPGSTPWNSENKGSATVERRYLSMNSIGYSWVVKSSSGTDGMSQQTVSVTFFDRGLHKDYHFVDYNGYDLCSINEKGALFASSGYSSKSALDNGRIYYRKHDSEQDAWERRIPLLRGEYITSVCVTNSHLLANMSDESYITVATNFGYVRFYNLHGLCVNLLKMTPVVTMISSSNSVLFIINQVAANLYSYSLVDMNQDYKFIQQDVLLPLKKHADSPDIPLIKGIFFNEYNDPCIIPGIDDTLLILQSWREANNARWVPILNCHNAVTDYGNDNRKGWKCWPLGVYDDQLNCLILKNNHEHPGFPLPIPIVLNIELPILIKDKSKKKKNDILEEELGDSDAEEPEVKQDDPEENFLRSRTFGSLAFDSHNDDNTEETEEGQIEERLNEYMALFDRSLLKLFGESCKDQRLNKALSVAKLMKTDKALMAASKISERMQFMNLATKIGELREKLLNEAEEVDEEEDD
ncbi:hypothetical protein G9P44_000969 [Scheffersomyces stipitis]|nr:hypothetical protein G9P44_000969 [Scheffersomyces stipitis]